MVKIIIDLLEFLRSCAPLLTSLAVLTVLCILLSKSIKKHATAYYLVLAIPFALVALPFTCRMVGIETVSFTGIPVLGELVRDYIHMAAFGHPLLIIIMYMGALDPKIPGVKKLLSIRKELSIISGFPVLAHSLIRVTNSIPSSFKFFADHAGYMANTKVASEWGAGISSFSFLLGLIMLLIFIPLWVTSFDSVRKRMSNVKWRKLQKWAYVLYATLFIHAMGIQAGGLLNPRGGGAPRPATVEVTVAENARPAADEHSGHSEQRETVKPDQNRQSAQTARPATGGHMPAKGLSDIKVSAPARGYIHIISLILIFSSYLYLRLRKAKRDAKRRANAMEAS
ncbi:MAG: ferric reductase-like transmembrane domain-containing protein [Tannerellaceae bacterium]|jgi:DMSO/TMAO reductase YedYZ heme-binding membrane subunit|nr:ferric reductase-like transmembrane domain-containing protein [Tannerellaceae bacterium]